MSDVKPDRPKICVNCAHYYKAPSTYHPNFNPPHQCRARFTQSRVTGVIYYDHCQKMRSVSGECGPDAKLFIETTELDPYEAQAYLPPLGIIGRLRRFFRPHG
jgi:hypothetical protein